MLQPGDQLGRYQIQHRLGQGGMGTLYLARDPVLERPVAHRIGIIHRDIKPANQNDQTKISGYKLKPVGYRWPTGFNHLLAASSRLV